MAKNTRITKDMSAVNAPAPIPPPPPADPLVPAPQALQPSADQNAQAYMSGMGPIPVMSEALTYQEIGQSGLRAFAGYVREEFLLQLQGRQGAQKYREMVDNSAIINSIIYAITSTMRKVEWRVEPANDSGEAAEMADFADSLRSDMSHTWEDTVVENLSMLTYGYAPHEIVYKQRLGRDPGRSYGRPLPSSQYDDGLIGWRKLPLRGQDTVLKWFFGPHGEIEGITQQPWVGPIVDIPIEKMLLFRPSSHKNNPEGRSILRSSYRPYYFVKRLEEQEAILFERMNGVPMIKVPSTIIAQAQAGDAKASAAMAMYKNIVRNIRIDEQMGLVLPSDMWDGPNGPSTQPKYAFELVTPQAGRASVKADESIRRYQTDMLTSVLADFITLGHDSHGTQSLATTKVDMFFQAIEGFLDSTASVYNNYGLPRLWKLNGLNEDLMPKYVPDMAVRVDLDVLSNFVLRLSQSGMPLFPDEDLQSMLRDAAGMPDVTSPEAMQVLETEQQQREATLETTLNPPAPPGGGSGFQKMILGAIAQRMIRHAGPRFGITTKGVKRLKRYQQRGHRHAA